jgi:hypothetical protein
MAVARSINTAKSTRLSAAALRSGIGAAGARIPSTLPEDCDTSGSRTNKAISHHALTP